MSAWSPQARMRRMANGSVRPLLGALTEVAEPQAPKHSQRHQAKHRRSRASSSRRPSAQPCIRCRAGIRSPPRQPRIARKPRTDNPRQMTLIWCSAIREALAVEIKLLLPARRSLRRQFAYWSAPFSGPLGLGKPRAPIRRPVTEVPSPGADELAAAPGSHKLALRVCRSPEDKQQIRWAVEIPSELRVDLTNGEHASLRPSIPLRPLVRRNAVSAGSSAKPSCDVTLYAQQLAGHETQQAGSPDPRRMMYADPPGGCGSWLEPCRPERVSSPV